MKRGYWELDVQIYRSIIRLMETVALFVEMFKSVNPAQLLLTSGVFHDPIELLLHAGLPASSIVIIYSRAQLSRSYITYFNPWKAIETHYQNDIEISVFDHADEVIQKFFRHIGGKLDVFEGKCDLNREIIVFVSSIFIQDEIQTTAV